MKFVVPQLMFFFQDKTTKRNVGVLSKFLAFLLSVICLYSVLFHLLMAYEGQDFSWITGLYWTLTVMTTLGFGDITFQSDVGRIFSIFVLMSGVLFLLIILPFTFIQFFYAPWLQAQEKARTPRQLPPDTEGHVLITNVDPITIRLIEYLNRRQVPYAIIIGNQQEAATLLDEGYRVIVGDLDRQATYRQTQVDKSALVVVTNDDLISTNICFTIRQVSEDVPIVTNAANKHSIDILEYSGNVSVYEFMTMLGVSLARRAFGVGQGTTVIGRFGDLLISELPVRYTSLEGKTLAQAGIRKTTGVTAIGMMEKGKFIVATPSDIINSQTILILAGTSGQLKAFDEHFAVTYQQSPDTPQVLILGGGRVGQVAAATLAQFGINFRIVEKRSTIGQGSFLEQTIFGDAADLETLKSAGIEQVKSVIITTHSDDMNIYLTFYCRQLRPDIQIISRSILERSVAKLHMAGADQVMSYASLGAGTIFQLLQPNEISLFTEGLVVLQRRAGQQFAGTSILTCGIREKTGLSIIAIRQEDHLKISPDPETMIEENDELIFIGTADQEKLFDELP
ncbi:MAG: NAD-binding protein [Desulfofustis sp.]|nr:NAD-binding protein [Desulfofustis sp.]